MSQAQGFPQISAPFVDTRSGIINQTWLKFLINLWNRTGAGSGNTGASPPGATAVFAGSTVPDGWLLCDGSAVSRTTYPALFLSLGTTWGSGDGSTTFNLPDFQGKFLMGANPAIVVGTYGGSSSHTLTIANLAPHTHAITDPGHLHGVTDPGHHHTAANADTTGTAGANAVGATEGVTGDSTTGVSVDTASTGITGTDSQGGGTAFSILPPYAAINWIIKA